MFAHGGRVEPGRERGRRPSAGVAMSGCSATELPPAEETLGWSRADLAGVGASGLRDLYRGEPVLSAEIERLFHREWILVSSIERLPAVGSYQSVDLCGAPVVLVRVGEESIRAYHNLCPHRGLPIFSGEGDGGRFVTCPYHQWSFRITGELASLPQREQFSGADLDCVSLAEVDLGIWNGLIFVRLGSGGGEFGELVGDLDRRMSTFLAGPLVEVAQLSFEIESNWKFLVENHVDVYHLWYLHAKTLAAFDHARFEWERCGRGWWSFEPPKAPRHQPPLLHWLPEAEAEGLGAHLIFPNTMVVTSSSCVAAYDVRPVSPTRSKVTLRVRSVLGADPEALVEEIKAFLSEDVEVCEGLQLGAASPAFKLGPLASRHEQPLRHFHEELRASLLLQGE